MVWQSGTIMDSRLEFVRLAEAGNISMAELCRRFGISRETGYAMLRRYRQEGPDGLKDRSRRPHHSPRRTPETMEARVVELRAAHPWGGRKIKRRLEDQGVEAVPAASTVSTILRRHDKLHPGEAVKHTAFKRFERSTPNALWQMDHKGHFALRHGRCHPLTVLDDHSRYSLGLVACGDQTLASVMTHLTALFRRYGMPEMILADNGSPWGGSGASGPTACEVWLMRLGVRLRHGRAYHPQTQGKEERFHRTLDVELLQGRRFAALTDCQAAFDAWRRVYNEERPHEALGLAVPASRYQASPVAFPETLPEPEYYPSDELRRVHADGAVSFEGHRIKLSQAFAGMDVAFRPTAIDGVRKVFFMRFAIAEVDLRNGKAHERTVRDVSEHLSGMSPV